MAKKNSLPDWVFKFGIVVAIIIVIWFVIKYLRDHGLHFGDGSGGSGILPTGGSGKKRLLPAKGTNVLDKLNTALRDEVLNPSKTYRIGLELELANREAKRYLSQGNKAVLKNSIINKTLTAANKLNDKEFSEAIRAWQNIDGFKDVLDTPLAQAPILTPGHSSFLTRYSRLTGKLAIQTAISNGRKIAGF